jgi:8-oxo-dGTP pyrophosphatase MutT (NUDIX family)
MLAVAGVAVEDGRILLVRDTHGFWAGVGGWIETGESPEDALLREVKEELGVEAEISRVFSPFIAWNVSGADDLVSFLLFLYGLRLGSVDFRLQEGELTDAVWAGPAEWCEFDMLPYVRALFDDRISEWMSTRTE